MKVREKKRLCRLKSVENLPGFEPITIFMQSVNYQYTVTCRNGVCGIVVDHQKYKTCLTVLDHNCNCSIRKWGKQTVLQHAD